MAMLNGNVVMFNPNPENEKNVYKAIRTFIDSKDSQNTRDSYERHIRHFFKTMRGKNIEDLVEEDLIFNKLQIDTYHLELKKNYKGKTVNATMACLRSLYQKLESYEFNVKASWFDVDRCDEHDTKSWDTLSHDEVVEIINLVSKTRKGKEKALLIRIAYSTAFRLNEILSLKWSDIVERDGVWCLRVLGKGNKWDIKKISPGLYNALMEHKKKSKGEYIFSLQKKTVNKMMAFIRENMDFGDRKIVFHSFRKASVDEVNLITQGNLKVLQRHANHANISTTLNTYTKQAELEDLVIVDVDYEPPVEKFDELTHEELLALVKSMDRTTQIKLLQKLGAI